MDRGNVASVTSENADGPVGRGHDALLMKLSEVRSRTGIAVESLRLLIEDHVLVRGVERARSGHVYIRSDQLPSYEQLVEMLQLQLVRHLQRAGDQLKRVEVEIEAVRNDVALALEDPRAPLGHDLLAFQGLFMEQPRSSLTSALKRLQEAAWDIGRYQAALIAAEKVGPELVD